MPLPLTPMPTGSVTVAGTAVPIRSLSRGERLMLATFDEDYRAAEAFIVASGTDTPVEEAKDWLYRASVEDADALIGAITELSGFAASKDEGADEDPPTTSDTGSSEP